jgi:hypothetical protein
METTGVSGESRNIWGKTGVFRENRVYGFSKYSRFPPKYSCFLQILPLSPYTLFSLNIPVFSQILLFSPDTPVKTGVSGGKREHLEKTEYMETTGVSGENRSIWGGNGSI